MFSILRMLIMERNKETGRWDMRFPHGRPGFESRFRYLGFLSLVRALLGNLIPYMVLVHDLNPLWVLNGIYFPMSGILFGNLFPGRILYGFYLGSKNPLRIGTGTCFLCRFSGR